jgi:hypothetical protein
MIRTKTEGAVLSRTMVVGFLLVALMAVWLLMLAAEPTHAQATFTVNSTSDPGANGLQNKPSIRSAVTSGGKTTLKGNLRSTPNTSFTVQFFANSSGEGKKFIGQKRVTTSSEGKVYFTFSPAQKVGAGQPVTATATGAEGTSEFSAPKTVTTS